MTLPANTSVYLSLFGGATYPLPEGSGHPFGNLRSVPLFERLREEFVTRFLRDHTSLLAAAFPNLPEDIARAGSGAEARTRLIKAVQDQGWAQHMRFTLAFSDDGSAVETSTEYVQDDSEFAAALVGRLIARGRDVS